MSDDLSLVIGKNNTGKTSILNVLDGFLNRSSKYSFDDFSISFQNELKDLVENETSEENFITEGISLTLFVQYGIEDDLSNISRVMMDLDPDNNFIVIRLEYSLSYGNYKNLYSDYRNFEDKESLKQEKDSKYVRRTFFDYMKSEHSKYFEFRKLSIPYNTANQREQLEPFIDLAVHKIDLNSIINFKYISASRGLSNRNLDKRLSEQTSRIYERTEETELQIQAIEKFKDQLTESDRNLSQVYKDLFKITLDSVKQFGGIKINETDIEIISTLQHRSLLGGNTTVVYSHDDSHRLPESHNGLGYMNLISMIFEITILVNEFRRSKQERPADINLLFIEEPEAHTHPQMQYVFIKNIKSLLSKEITRSDGLNRKLQYIITTHSPHIVTDSNFDDIRYMRKSKNCVISKNMKDLKRSYDEDTKQYHFLRQYLTLTRAEAFFADKIILIEGDTERILMPTLLRKVDLEETEKYVKTGNIDPHLPLCSQNISTIEIGSYSHIFEKFISFVGIKTLIITDLDTTNSKKRSCQVSKGVNFSNPTIKYFFPKNVNLQQLRSFKTEDKLFKYTDDSWHQADDGYVCVTYQLKEQGHQSRSFEESFIHLNKYFINPISRQFRGIQNSKFFRNGGMSSFDLAKNCIKKKTHFALDIIYHSNTNLDNWRIPSYIREGLLWIKKD